MNDYYVYEWFNVDNKEVFYVGKGCKNRYKDLYKRNKYFKNYYNKYNCDVRKVKRNLTEDEAFKLEIELIAQYRKIGQAKCNIANGGEGSNFPDGSWNSLFRKLQYLHDVIKAMDGMDNEEDYDIQNLKKKSLKELKDLYKEYTEYKENLKWLKVSDIKIERPSGFELKIENEEIIELTNLLARNIAKNNDEFKSFLNYKTELDFLGCDFNTDDFIKLIIENMDYYKEFITDILNMLWFMKTIGKNSRLTVYIKIKSYTIKNGYIHIKFNTTDEKKPRRVRINLYDIIWDILVYQKNKALYQIIFEEIFSSPFV